jgi:3-isopropylmalate/(R)-2-methylmalate dehydratase small subunit
MRGGMSEKKFSGKVWKFGNNIDTDIIIPARYLVTSDPALLAEHCMDGEFPNFMKAISPGDIILAGDNFGCGSSREHAPICIKAAGISCVVATSFARIFFRNAINIGLPVFEAPGVWNETEQGDEIEINPAQGRIRNITKGSDYPAAVLPDFIREIIDAGGLISWVRSGIR